MAKKKEKIEEKTEEKTKEKSTESSTETPSSSVLTKVSMLLLYLEAISPDVTKKIYAHIGEKKSQRILKLIANLGKVDKKTIKPVIDEAHTILINQDSIIGGKHLSGKIIQEVYGGGLEDSTSDSEIGETAENAFLFLKDIEDERLIEFFDISSEAMGAFIFSLLNEEKAASLLQKIDEEKAQRLLEKTIHLKVGNLPILASLGESLEKELTKSETGIQINEQKQIEHLSHVLEMVTEEQRNTILDQMKKENKEVAEKIEKKIFTFADLINCEDEDMAIIITDIKNLSSLAFALKKCDDNLAEKIKNNVSARQKEILTEEEKTMPEKIKPKDITKGQAEILSIAKRLEKEEKINPLVKEIKGKGKEKEKEKINPLVKEIKGKGKGKEKEKGKEKKEKK